MGSAWVAGAETLRIDRSHRSANSANHFATGNSSPPSPAPTAETYSIHNTLVSMADPQEAYNLFGAKPAADDGARSESGKKQLQHKASSVEDVVHSVVAFDKDGRLNLDFEGKDDDYDISDLQQHDQQIEQYEASLRSISATAENVPTMNICIMIVGTRGDVQPFIGIAKRLQQDGHRVRLATHAVYRDFVTEHHVEFYPLGGDPKELAAYMVKTGGHLIPLKYETITKDVPRNLEVLDEILNSTWPAVSAADPDALGEGMPGKPFQAQAIISNPVTYGHIHVAERLGVPLHIMFPQPWVPTVAFPHPLSNLSYDDKPHKRNYISYKLVDTLMWQGTEGIVNQFRTQVLGLRKIRKGDGGPDILHDLAIPHAFMWSPALVPKPADWGNIYDVIGTVLLKEAGSNYTPTPELEAFLGTDGGPIFVGFGSMVIADPKATTTMVIEAARLANVRVLIQSSWSDMAAGIDVPDNIFFIGNCPHDWLMPRVSAVVHHGGAGTTAAGLLAGKPTFIVPFFGDQPFWGQAVVRVGVGVKPCPIKELSVEKLHKAFVGLQTPEIRARALALRDVMNSEDGVGEAVKCFYRHLPLKVMRCEVCETNLATKWSQKDKIRLCFECEFVITSRPENSVEDIRDYQCVDYRARGPDSTLGGVASGTGALLHELGGGVKDMFSKPVQGYREQGATGAVIGLTKGVVSGLLVRPIQGFAILADHIATGVHNERRDSDERKKGSVWLGGTSMREAVGMTAAPAAHTASMSRDENVRGKKTTDAPSVPVFVSTEDRQKMTSKFQDMLALRGTHADYRDDLIVRSVSELSVNPSAQPRTIPKMAICMLTTGTWSDSIQQFVTIGMRLKADGHRVRIATNEVYRDRIMGAGLEFFPLGGNANTVGRYLVHQHERHTQKRGLFGSMKIQHDFPDKEELKAFVFSLWPACVEVEQGSSISAFRPDLVISHPLVFGQSIVAERLGVPLHCISTTPLSQTQSFPHALLSNAATFFPLQPTPANAASFEVVDTLLWKGMHDILDRFRSFLGLSGDTSRRNTLRDWRIPHTYLWNPTLLPKPSDWGPEICVAGALDLHEPIEEVTRVALGTTLADIERFVTEGGTPIVYFGFVRGDWEPSRVERLLREIEVAASTVGVRVIVQTVEEPEMETLYRSPTVLEVPSSVPIQMLMPFAAGALHWGDGSAVAAWLCGGVPSCVVARNAMQRIWGQAIAWAGVGPKPLDLETLSSSSLVIALRQLLDPSVAVNARRVSASFSPQVAVETVVHHLYSTLPLDGMLCDLDPTRIARIYEPKHELKLSWEAHLVVQSILHGEDETTNYKPLSYALDRMPRFSLRRLGGGPIDDDKSQESSRLRAASRGRLARAKSAKVNFVEVATDWTTPDAWEERVREIHAAYEMLLRRRGGRHSIS